MAHQGGNPIPHFLSITKGCTQVQQMKTPAGRRKCLPLTLRRSQAVKAPVFDTGMRWFKSSRLSQPQGRTMRYARRVRRFRCKFSDIWASWVLWRGSSPEKTTPSSVRRKRLRRRAVIPLPVTKLREVMNSIRA